MITYPNLFHLRYFVDAVDLGSVSLAAKKNSVSHPAISRAVKALEEYLSLSLTEHKRRSFAVTKAGFEVAEQARTLLEAAANFNEHKLNSVEESGSLTFGISRSLSEAYLCDILKRLKTEFPRVQVQIKFGTTNEITEAVARNSLDLGLTVGSNKLPTISSKLVQQGEFVLVTAAGGNAVQKMQDSLFILTEPRFETELLKNQYASRFGRNLNLAYEIGSWSVISELVEQRLGIGLIPDFMLAAKKSIACRRLKANWFKCEYGVYLHSSNRSLAKRFVRDVAEHIKGSN